MPNTRRSFSTEFKQDAAGLALYQGCSITEAARSVAIENTALRRWFEQLKIERGGETPTIKALTHEQRQAAEVSSASCGNKALILARIMDSSNIILMEAFGI